MTKYRWTISWQEKILKVYFILSCLDHIQTSALPQKKKKKDHNKKMCFLL